MIGHYSLNCTVSEEHFNFQERGRGDFFPRDKQDTSSGTPISILSGIIKALSFEGNTIIDATLDSGKICLQSTYFI